MLKIVCDVNLEKDAEMETQEWQWWNSYSLLLRLLCSEDAKKQTYIIAIAFARLPLCYTFSYKHIIIVLWHLLHSVFMR